MMNESNRDKAVQLFREVESLFINLKMKLDLEPDNVDVQLDIPQQDGLLFPVSLNLQNSDALHLNVGAFCQEWFPCSDEVVSRQYFAAVAGLLSGENRLVEYHRGKRIVKVQLQRPAGEDWETIATWSRLHLPVPLQAKTSVLQNTRRHMPSR